MPEKKSKMNKMRRHAQDAEWEVQEKVGKLTQKHGEKIDIDLHEEYNEWKDT